jgi:hypothetical protein
MKARLRDEWQRLMRAARQLDRQTVFVLLAAAVFVIIQMTFGSRQVFRRELAHLFPEDWRGVLAWGWWFFMQGVTGFALPVLCLTLLFKRRPAEVGLGRGDWKLAVTLALVYIPLVIIGTWVLSDSADFQASYPHYQPAAHDWRFFLVYEALFLFYWFGWEYLWRGFVLFGTAHTFGLYAIIVQAMPFAILHFSKPLPEALLSVVGGVALGALVWRCRSFWIAVPIHAAQMLILDLWCTLRIRTGVQGIGPGALLEMMQAWLGGAG